MSDTHAAPDAGAGDAAPVSVITPAADTPETLTPMAAARALAQARWSKNKQPEEAAPAEAAPEEPISAQAEDAAAVEEQPPGDTTETAEPEDNLPPIEPPRSWTKEARERFNALPRETQEYLAEREQERDRELRRSQNEAAEQRKAIEAERQTAEKARQQYEAALPTLMQTLQDAQAGAFSDVKTVDDVTRLAQEDPFRYLQWQAHQTKMQAVQAEMRAAQERQTTEQQSKWTEHVQKEEALFIESLSDADRAKIKDFQSEAPEFLQAKGFTRQELNELASGKDRLSIYDRRVQSLILDGIKYQAAQKAAKTVAAKPVPQVQKPGTAQPRGAAQAEALTNLTAKLERSGSLRDAVALRVAQQKAASRA
jgi:hypothetical protein